MERFDGIKLHNLIKLIICMIVDVIDFVLGAIPIFGVIFDLFSIILSYAFWGPIGLLGLWEVIEPTNVIDAFIPTNTIIAILAIVRKEAMK